MKILSPPPFDIGVAAATIPLPYNIRDQLGVSILRVFSILMLLEKEEGKGYSVNFKIESIRPTAEQINHFFSLESLIKTCVTNAEAINARMKSIMLQDLAKDNTDREQIATTDFMKLKDYLMDFVKQDEELKSISTIDTPEKFKEFRQNFNSYITDRNIYTHGQLKFLRKSSQYLIEFMKGLVPAFVRVDIENLISHNAFYTIANGFLSDFHSLMVKRKKDKPGG